MKGILKKVRIHRSILILSLFAFIFFSFSMRGDSQTPYGEIPKIKPPTVVSPPPDSDLAPPPPPPDQTQPQADAAKPSGTYRVVPGDSLSQIAARFLGDPARFWEIVEKNKSKYPSIVNNPNLIHPGWELEIPGGVDVTEKERTAPQFSGDPSEGIVEVDTSLNIRAGPWGKIIGSFHDGDKVKIVSKEGDWYKIDWNGQTAYVHANYVATKDRPSGQVTVREPNAPAETDSTPVTLGSGRFGAAPCSPMPGRISSPFGWRDWNGDGKKDFHEGVDLPIANGTRLNALGDGVVVAAGYESGGGRYIKIRYDNGLESFYCHLQSSSAQAGQRVSMGQEVARSDNTGRWTTGAHLHMAIRKNGVAIDPKSIPGLPLP